MITLIPRDPGRIRFEHSAQAVRGHPPVVVGIAVNPEVQGRRDDEEPAWLEDAKDLVKGASDLEDMLKCFDTEDRARSPIAQADPAHILDLIDAGAWPHVAADIRLGGKELAEVGVVDLAFDLIRTELIHRRRAVESLGDELAERLVMVSHRRRLLHERRAVWRQERKGCFRGANLRENGQIGQCRPEAYRGRSLSGSGPVALAQARRLPVGISPI